MDSIFNPNCEGIGSTVGYAAMLLAMTRTLMDEDILKKIIEKEKKLKFVVTEMGGKSNGDFQEKISKAVLGASLNGGIIKKDAASIHAVLHAAEEAKRGVLINMTSITQVALKIAIVRDETWIAVAMFGESFIHPVTNHERCGLGIMHI